MNRDVDHNERFLVERNGEPAVLVLSVADFVKKLAPYRREKRVRLNPDPVNDSGSH